MRGYPGGYPLVQTRGYPSDRAPIREIHFAKRGDQKRVLQRLREVALCPTSVKGCGNAPRAGASCQSSVSEATRTRRLGCTRIAANVSRPTTRRMGEIEAGGSAASLLEPGVRGVVVPARAISWRARDAAAIGSTTCGGLGGRDFSTERSW